MSVGEHYDRFLAEHYSWMLGDLDARVAETEQSFRALGFAPEAGARAVDLGCGSGLQTLALARLGYAVRAVDRSRRLLDELAERADGLPVEAVESDLLDPRALGDEPPELVVCMGDTLTHLERFEDVARLIDEIGRRLAPGGRVMLAWRDLSTPLEGTARFLPVRSDADRILTCVLEHRGGRVRVTDLLHLREGDGFAQHASSYFKLVLPRDDVLALVEEAGLARESIDAERGMLRLVARRVPA